MAAGSSRDSASVRRRSASSAAEQGLQIIDTGIVIQKRTLTNIEAILTAIAKCLPEIMDQLRADKKDG